MHHASSSCFRRYSRFRNTARRYKGEQQMPDGWINWMDTTRSAMLSPQRRISPHFSPSITHFLFSMTQRSRPYTPYVVRGTPMHQAQHEYYRSTLFSFHHAPLSVVSPSCSSGGALQISVMTDERMPRTVGLLVA